MNVYYTYLAAIAVSLFATIATAQSTPDSDGDPSVPPTIELALRPAPEPYLPLKARLLPKMSERTPGNAATYYYRALMHQAQLKPDYWKEHDEKSQAWLAATHEKFPKEEVAKWLAGQQMVLKELKTAVYREHCDWDLRLHELRGTESISFLLHEFQEMRRLGRTLRLKAHYEIIDGRPEDALETLRMGYQMARDAAQPPFLLNGLIGIAISATMNEELQYLIENSDTNLYWTIASLPDPLIDLRPAMEFEMNLPLQIYPFLKDAETANRSPEEWRKLIVECIQSMQDLTGPSNSAIRGWQSELAAAAIVAKLYPTAKAELISQGMDPQRLEQMPVGQVVAILTSRSLQHAYQELFKLTHLPHQQSSHLTARAMDQLKKEGFFSMPLSGREGIPIASLILPALEAVQAANIRLATSMAGLRTLEALRMHAAANGGKLPPSLADVTVVPVPNNPRTGQPFTYSYDADQEQATLDVPSPSATPRDQRQSKRYVIRIQKTVKK